METGRDAHGIKSLNRHTLEQIVAASSAGVVIVDANRPELPIVYVNAAYERLTGYTLADLAGRPWPVLARAGDDTLLTVSTSPSAASIMSNSLSKSRVSNPFSIKVTQ
jgi:PAS domain-containing protein